VSMCRKNAADSPPEGFTRKLDYRVELRRCSEASLEVHDLNGTIDFALAFAVVHEVPDPDFLLDEIAVSYGLGESSLLQNRAGM